MAKTVTIKNKKTGETKTIPVEQLLQYGINEPKPTQLGQSQQSGQNTAVQAIQQRLQELSQGQPQQQGVSNTPSAIGQAVGGIAGTPLGPIGRMAGAGIGSGVGQEVAQAQAGQPGDPGAFLQTLGPVGMMARLAQKGIQGPDAEKSPTEKAMQRGVASQMSGEALAGFMKLLKPGTVTEIMNNITTYLSKKGKGVIPVEKLERRFLNETLPKALQSSGTISEEPIVEGGKNILKEKATNVFDPEELNFFRKQLNAIGKGDMESTLKKFIANDLARIVREEQTALVPATKATLGVERMGYQIPQILRQLPLGRLFFGAGGQSTGLTGMVGTGLSKLSGLAKYGLGPLMNKVSEKQ